MLQNDTTSLQHDTHTRYANGIRNPTTPDTAELHETASGGAAGRKNRSEKPHPRTTTDTATKGKQQMHRRDPTPPHETGKKETGMPNKFRESTVHEITKEIPEKNVPSHTIPPWRNNAKEKRYAMRLTTNPARQRYHKRGSSRRTPNKNITKYHKKTNILLHTPTDQ